jgi:hypothetical protein
VDDSIISLRGLTGYVLSLLGVDSLVVWIKLVLTLCVAPGSRLHIVVVGA